MQSAPSFDPRRNAQDGDRTHWQEGGFTFEARIHHDADAGCPWKREDGHGPVSDWRPLNGKRAGERVLYADHGIGRFYDFAEAVRIARRDGWGVSLEKREELVQKLGRALTPGELAEAAAEADFARLRAWCWDEWSYVGVAVQVFRAGVALTEEYDFALWGIESDAGEYLNEVARELAAEAKPAAEKRLAELPTALPL